MHPSLNCRCPSKSPSLRIPGYWPGQLLNSNTTVFCVVVMQHCERCCYAMLCRNATQGCTFPVLNWTTVISVSIFIIAMHTNDNTLRIPCLCLHCVTSAPCIVLALWDWQHFFGWREVLKPVSSKAFRPLSHESGVNPVMTSQVGLLVSKRHCQVTSLM